MSPVMNWDEWKEMFSPKIKFFWREIDNGIDLGGALVQKAVLQKNKAIVIAAIRNRSDLPIAANCYVGVDVKKKQECGKYTTDDIEGGQVWSIIWAVPLKTRKQNKIGTHNIGLFTELRNAKQKAKQAARIALADVPGISVGKVHGISLGFKVVGPNTLKCPNCNSFLNYRPLKEGSIDRHWVCETCKQHYIF